VTRVSDGAQLFEIEPGGTIVDIECSPDGRFVALGLGDKKKLQVWQLKPKMILFQTSLGSYSLDAFAWSPSGDVFAHSLEPDSEFRSSEGLIHLYETKSWTLIQKLRGQNNWLWQLTWSPEGDRLCGAGWDQTVWVWDVRTGAVVHRLKGHSGWISSVAWSPDGLRICSASPLDKWLRLWNAGTGDEVLAIPLEDVAGSAAWSGDGRRLAIVGQSGKVSILNSATRRQDR
jgi:WD40 repeat protein